MISFAPHSSPVRYPFFLFLEMRKLENLMKNSYHFQVSGIYRNTAANKTDMVLI